MAQPAIQPAGTTTPPLHDDNAEQAVLGALLAFDGVYEPVTERLTTADFYRPIHATIYATLTAQWAAGRPTDPLTIAHQLVQDVLFQRSGGLNLLHTMLAQARTPRNAPWHADIVAACSHRRRLVETAARIQNLVAHAPDPAAAATTALRLLDETAAVVTAPAVNGNRWRGRIRLTAASQFEIRPVHWLWANRIPQGEITLVAGREGVGKSTWLAWLAAAITNGNLPGHHGPTDQQPGTPRAVLYAATEDSWEYTVAPRMLAAGADLTKVYRVDTTHIDGQLVLPRDCDIIPDLARDTGAAILMCDPIISLLDDDISPNRARELRRALEPLRSACEAGRIACTALAHFNKSQADDIGSLVAGARTWVEVARAVIGIVQDRDADTYTCILSQIKNNLGRLDLPNLAYTIQTVELETNHGEPAYVGRVHWLGESDLSAEDILMNRTRPDQRPLGDTSQGILQHVRDHGHPIATADVIAAFPDIAANTVRQCLARLVRSGRLHSPVRGTYTA